MQIRQTYSQPPPWLSVFNSERDYNFVTFTGDRHLAANILVLVAALGKDQKHRLAGFDRINYLIIEWSAWLHVAWRDPARHATTLQLAHDFQCGRSIFADMVVNLPSPPSDVRSRFRTVKAGALSLGGRGDRKGDMRAAAPGRP